MKLKILLNAVFVCAAFVTIGFSHDVLKLNLVKKFSLQPGDSKAFLLNLKKDDFAEIKWTSGDSGYIKYKIIAPSGRNLTDYAVALDDSFIFIVPENGDYKIEATRSKFEEETGAQEFSVEYKNKFALPKNSVIKASRKINGYDAKIYEIGGESDDAFLMIEKAGRLKYIAKGTKNVGGLSFADTLEKGASKAENSSASLFGATADKTGDGTPDLAVSYYSGGAHCCFSMYFYELGDEVKPIKALDTGDAGILAIGKSANGSLKLSSGDTAFAYWNTSFAGSPIPSVILDFRDGEFQPNAKLMQKAAPPLAKLKQEAASFRAKMPLDAYTSYEAGADLGEAFWGRMLELIYSGHEDLAWQYFDWAWNPRKKGKENFRKDFEKQLASSEFYRMFQASK
ncbi:MAG TPA: emp24/gp25L/p24 family protein [Pyrinomonadaceae bacterium]|nr:emp24/gp25L/p24 family protein [Pyrinomonadaceae bacterium]